jgi:hypothetical protein
MREAPCPHQHRPGGTGGVGVLVAVTVLALLAAPHAKALRDSVPAGLPAIRLPRLDRTPPAVAAASPRAGRAVAFALAQRGKPYRWGAQGPQAFDCSGLTWAAWRAAGVAIPRTAAAQLTGLPRVRGLRPGDLVVYRSDGPTRRHVAMLVGRGRMVEAIGRGVPVRVTGLRGGWLGAVRPGGAR